jgi:hypothetical protein
MKRVLIAGLVLVVLGTWLIVLLPGSAAQRTNHGETNIKVQPVRGERVPPITSLELIAGGIALTLAGTHRRRPGSRDRDEPEL